MFGFFDGLVVYEDAKGLYYNECHVFPTLCSSVLYYSAHSN